MTRIIKFSKRIVRLCMFYVALWNLAFNSQANIVLPAIISNNMVLQQNSKVRLWGSATSGRQVCVQPSWGKKRYTTVADGSGAWEIMVGTSPAGGPFQISFKEGEELVISNVLLGEVWLCSGQSNMVMPLKGYDKNQFVLNSVELMEGSGKFNQVRFFEVPKVVSPVPLTDCNGSWKVSNSENAPNFSALAYQYARAITENLHVPVGIISACWGSTAIQSWMSESNLRKFPEIQISQRLDTMKIPAANPESVCAVLFNGMISPVTRYGIKGFLWYQGESNKDPRLYQALLPAMVQEWRSVWNRGKLPFYYVQIAPYNYQDRNTAFVREAQLNARIPNSGMIVTIDAGQANRIHPPDKTVISERLARYVLAKTYTLDDVAYKSPRLKSFKFRSGHAVLIFKNVSKGLISKNDTLAHFEVAGRDKIFHPAVAEIKSKSKLNVSSKQVSKPVAVRYAFKNWVTGDLFNSEDLPASSFRTDKFEH